MRNGVRISVRDDAGESVFVPGLAPAVTVLRRSAALYRVLRRSLMAPDLPSDGAGDD